MFYVFSQIQNHTIEMLQISCLDVWASALQTALFKRRYWQLAFSNLEAIMLGLGLQGLFGMHLILGSLQAMQSQCCGRVFSSSNREPTRYQTWKVAKGCSFSGKSRIRSPLSSTYSWSLSNIFTINPQFCILI